MINTQALRGIIVSKGETQRSVAKKIGVSETAFYRKMNRGIFNSNEMYELVKLLSIENPVPIFFADKVAQ
jgi:hypothetical protein